MEAAKRSLGAAPSCVLAMVLVLASGCGDAGSSDGPGSGAMAGNPAQGTSGSAGTTAAAGSGAAPGGGSGASGASTGGALSAGQGGAPAGAAGTGVIPG